MTVYSAQGPYVFVSKERHEVPLKKLPTAIYMLEYNPMQGYYLKATEDFKFSGKIYGNIEPRTKRVINTFRDRSENMRVSTGVLLSGEKGSGKTLLAKNIAAELLKQNMSTIICNQSACGTQFNEFMATFDEPVCVIFDEYEKVYSEPKTQEALLTLFDGLFQSQMLFILTCNKKIKIDENMINRPGRIYYNYDYDGLELEFVREYLADNLKDISQVDNFIRYISNMIETLNFDMLKALVEEVNRYGETLKDAVSHLNISTYGVRKMYKVINSTIIKVPDVFSKWHPEAKELKIGDIHEDFYDGAYVNIFKDEGYITLDYSYIDSDGDMVEEATTIQIKADQIVSVKDDKITFQNENFRIQIEEVKPSKDKDFFAYGYA